MENCKKETFKDKLNIQVKELNEKIKELNAFLKSDKVEQVSEDNLYLLTIQLAAMEAYSYTLTCRIENLEQEEAPKTDSDQGLDFSEALLILRKGLPVSRKGWNGANMFVVLSPGAKDLPSENIWTPALQSYSRAIMKGKMTIRPTFLLKTAQDDIAYWNPSNSDILAEDWFEIKYRD